MSININEIQKRNKVYADYLRYADSKGNRNNVIDTREEAQIAAEHFFKGQSYQAYNNFVDFLTGCGYSVEKKHRTETPLYELNGGLTRHELNGGVFVNNSFISLNSFVRGDQRAKQPYAFVKLSRPLTDATLHFICSGGARSEGLGSDTFRVAFVKGNEYLKNYDIFPPLNFRHEAFLKIPAGTDYIYFGTVGNGFLEVALEDVFIVEKK